jgi:hypothetical protein
MKDYDAEPAVARFNWHDGQGERLSKSISLSMDIGGVCSGHAHANLEAATGLGA